MIQGPEVGIEIRSTGLRGVADALRAVGAIALAAGRAIVAAAGPTIDAHGTGADVLGGVLLSLASEDRQHDQDKPCSSNQVLHRRSRLQGVE